MNTVIVKMACFLLVVVLIGALNNWYINGPQLQHNAELSRKQFGGAPLNKADFQIAGYSVSFNTVYIVEVIFLALLALGLFLSHILNLLFGEEISA